MDRDLPAEQMRVGDEEREAVVAALHEHASSGRLDAEELDARVEQVLLRALPDAPQPAQRPVRPSRAVARFRYSAGVWAVFSVFFIVLWALGDSESFWPVWPILGWGLAVALQGIKVLTGSDEGDDEPWLPRGA